MSSLRVKEQKKRYEEMEHAALQRKIQPLLDQQQAMLRELANTKRKLLRQWYGVPDVNVLIDANPVEAPVCEELTTLPITSSRSIRAERKAYHEALNILKTTKGFTLAETGQKRLVYFVLPHALRNLDFSKPESWILAFERLNDSGSFADGEVTYDASDILPVIPEQESEPAMQTLGDLDKIDTSTREGQEQAREIANSHLWGVEARTMMREWKDSLAKNFQFYPSAADEKRVIDLFIRNSWNWLDRRNYDSARLSMVRQGFWSKALMTEAERLNEELEATDLSQLPHNQRVALNNRLRQVH